MSSSPESESTTRSTTKPKLITPFQFTPSDENNLAAYIKVVKNWNDSGCDSFPSFTPLDRIEHRLFKLFFFDVVEAPPQVFPINCNVDDLMKKAKYVVHFLLRLSENGDELEDPEPDECKEHRGSDASQQNVDDVKGTASSAPTDQQRQVIVSAYRDNTVQPQSQKQLCCFPTLPPELVAYILQFLDASHSTASSSQRYASLAECALVNRTWHSIALPLMWKTVSLCSLHSGFRLVRGLLNNSCFPKASQLQGWPGKFIVKLKLSFTDLESVWYTLLKNLFLFSKLRRLTLEGLPSLHGLSLLSDQHLPFLTHLGIKEFACGGDSFSDYAPVIEREPARAVFSRLSSVKWNDLHEQDESIFLDAAHQTLRQIGIPDSIFDSVFDSIARRFFEQCSDALSVVRMFQPRLSRSTLEVLATKCTGLRALVIREAVDMDLTGFECLMRLRGSQLVALQLCDDESETLGYLDPVMRLITEHCESLEYLNLCTYACSSRRRGKR